MLDRPTLDPSIALVAYAESLVDGQRVVVFGEATSHLASQLLERGARLVHVYDADATRAAEAAARNRSPNLWFAPLSDGDLALRERSFDFALVENIANYAEPTALLKRIRRTLTGRGAALVACPNPDVRLRLLADTTSTTKTLDYYALYDAVAAHFPNVRMLGQMPFVGYALADFGTEREPEPTFDSGFVPGGAEEPEWFIALASEHQTRLDEFAIVQLPFRAALGSTKTIVLEQQLRTALAAERHSRERLAELEARGPRVPSLAGAGAAGGEIGELRRELTKREAWITELEARAAAADERADATQTELDEVRAQLTELEQRMASELAAASAAPAPELTAAAAAGEQALLELAESEARRAELELRARQAEDLVAGLRAQLDDFARSAEEGAARELAALEAQLTERGAEVRRLERELREAERVGRELVRELRTAETPPEPAAAPTDQPLVEVEALRHKLDALAALNAEREADLAAARWAVEVLEARLEEVDNGGRAHLPSPASEEGQADLQRRAVLLEQLRPPRGT